MIKDINDRLTLADGATIPQLGFGTWKMKPDGTVQKAVRTAIETGYRHIDGASAYENEEGVGQGIRDSGVAREELFLTTKVFNDEIREGTEGVLKSATESLRQLGTDYVDLYLLHWPIPEHQEAAWKALEQLHAEGRARSIGVCNYMPDQLEKFLRLVNIRPVVNQVEFHPLLTQPALLAMNRENRIVQEAWSPIMQGGADKIPLLHEIAQKYGKSASQVVLRWDLQMGVVTIPKSSTPERIRENAALYDFELSADEVESISALDKGKRFGPDPYNFAF